MKMKKYLLAVLVCILGLLLPISVDAAEKNERYGLTLRCEVSGTEISLYQLTDGVERGSCRLITPFKKYESEIKGLDELDTLNSEGWRNLAVTLEETVAADRIKALSVQKVDENGRAVWENLNKGLYLILGSETKDKNYVYTPSPMLIEIPNQTESGVLQAHPVLKYNKIEKEPIKEAKNLEVIKVWKDSENKKNRPSEVTIELLKDGKAYKTVKLNKKNNWKYEWKNLSADHRWTIKEKNISSSYRVEYSKTGSQIYVINHYKTPETSEKPKPPKHSETEKPKKLPQTGQMWWPVPVLMVTGILFWLIGWTKRKIYEKGKD